MAVGNSELVEEFDQFYNTYYDTEVKELAQRYPSDQRSLRVDWDDIYRFDPDLADDYLAQPEQVQRYAEEALRLSDFVAEQSLRRVHVRVHNLPSTNCPDISEIRSRHMNRLIEITGTVDSISNIKSEAEEAAFECQLCGTFTYVPQSGNGKQEPFECQGCERDGPFKINDDHSSFVDAQTIYIEHRTAGVNTDDDLEVIAAEVTDDLVGEVVPGNTVHVSGILRRDDEINDTKSSIPDKYLEAGCITKADQIQLDIGSDEKQRIYELSESDSIYEQIVSSIAPTVHGHQQEKLALVLQLFSGVTKILPDDTRIRGDIHIGIIGDPGVAKSKLARYAARVAPRSVLVSGTTTSQVGLTAAATRTSNSSRSWTFEGGALPKADGGVACVDNITDLQSDELRALHDVLEEQVVEASKGSSTVSIPARASLLAVGNPKYGRFDQYEPIAEQVNLEPGFLSQLDLLFIISDEPDEDEDSQLADQVLQTNYAGQLDKQRTENTDLDVDEGHVEEQLEQVSPVIEPELLRKYVGFAKNNCHPRMTENAKNAIRDFYVDLRSKRDEDISLPISARKLEALVRLSEASARIRLSDTIERADAERVIELVRSSLEDLGVEATEPDSEPPTVAELNQEDSEEKIKTIINNIEGKYDGGAPIELVLERAREGDMDEPKAEHILEKLKQKGEVYEPKTDSLRTT